MQPTTFITRAPGLALALALALLLVACGPPPKPAGLIRLEALRAQPATKSLQERDPNGWRESDTYYRMAHESWQSSDVEDSESYSTLATIAYRSAEATGRKLEAEERLRAASKRIEVAKERERYYLEETEKLQARVTELTEELSTADQRARSALMRASAEARAASTPDEGEVAALRRDLSAAQEELKRTEDVKAHMLAAASYNKARNLLSRAEQELRVSDLSGARATLTEARTEIEAARSAAAPRFQEMERTRLAAERKTALLAAAGAIPDVGLRDEPRGVVVAIPGLFAPGNKVQMEGSRRTTLDLVTKLVQDFSEFQILVEGHTDDSGSKGSRQARSERFADEVSAHMVERGVDAGRLRRAGYGDGMPLEENRTRAGKTHNRRVEVVFLRQR